MRDSFPWIASSFFHVTLAACLGAFPLEYVLEADWSTYAQQGGVVTIQIAQSLPDATQPVEVVSPPPPPPAEMAPTPVEIARETSPRPLPPSPLPLPVTEVTPAQTTPQPRITTDPPPPTPDAPPQLSRAATAAPLEAAPVEIPETERGELPVPEPSATVQLTRPMTASEPPPAAPPATAEIAQAAPAPTAAEMRRPQPDPTTPPRPAAVAQASAPRPPTDAAPTTVQVTVLPTARQRGNSVDQLPRRNSDNIEPLYPEDMRARLLDGYVVLLVAIDASGAVTDVSVSQSSGHASFDRSALDAVRRWRFTPAQRGGRAVAYEVRVPIEFRIRGR